MQIQQYEGEVALPFELNSKACSSEVSAMTCAQRLTCCQKIIAKLGLIIWVELALCYGSLDPQLADCVSILTSNAQVTGFLVQDCDTEACLVSTTKITLHIRHVVSTDIDLTLGTLRSPCTCITPVHFDKG